MPNQADILLPAAGTPFLPLHLAKCLPQWLSVDEPFWASARFRFILVYNGEPGMMRQFAFVEALEEEIHSAQQHQKRQNRVEKKQVLAKSIAAR
mgnify:CR=1 FL=1